MKRLFLALFLTVALAGSALAGPWIHVEVLEKDGAEVRVNLPMSAVEVALEVAEDEAFDQGYITIDETDITVEELRAIWQELRSSGDGEYVRVMDGDEHVRVFRQGDYIKVHVSDGDDELSEQVNLEVPVSVVDALLSGSGDQLNIRAAIEELQKTTQGEVINIRDGRDHIRIWID